MKKYLISMAVICVIYLVVCNASASIIYAKDAMNMCCEMIIPTLFPFFICSGILIYSGFCEVLAKIFRGCMKPLFGINPAGSSAFILGIVSGYPLGAVTAGELYENNYLSKTEAERLLAFCNNSGPLFILGSVGAAVYANMSFGIMLYVTHILAALTVGILFRFYKKNSFVQLPTIMSSPERSVGEIFNIALQNAIKNILTVCGAVVFFSIISRIILDIFPLEGTIYAVLSGITEFATGTLKISALTVPIAEKLILTAFIVGFAGISVHMQVIAVIAKYRLSLVPYFAGKLLHGIFAALYTIIYLHFRPITEAVFNPSASKAFAAASSFEIAAAICTIAACVICAAVLFIKEKSEQTEKS